MKIGLNIYKQLLLLNKIKNKSYRWKAVSTIKISTPASIKASALESPSCPTFLLQTRNLRRNLLRRIFLNARCECVVEDKVFFPEVFADFFVVFLMQKLIKKNHRSIPGFEV